MVPWKSKLPANQKSGRYKIFPSISASCAMFEAQKNLMEISTHGGNLLCMMEKILLVYRQQLNLHNAEFNHGLLKLGTFGMVMRSTGYHRWRIWGMKIDWQDFGEDASVYKNKLAQNEYCSRQKSSLVVVSLNEKQKTIQMYDELLNKLLAQVEDGTLQGLLQEMICEGKEKRSECSQ